MAKILKTFTPPARKGGRPPEYPWADWFDGQIRVLTKGEDFHTTLHSMEVFIRRTAALKGFKVSLSLDPEAETITLVPKPDPAAQQAGSKSKCATAAKSAPRSRKSASRS